ncbi:probable serine/threonine-protein kinase DDB_G0282963 [Teleopsis dalmanni]|uniref:probable serine/threonine-protein kinase DDB_G0282963 n=1 Tax=Teleopsis dalmanni TaxID=139649 RepID=UPI0018CCFFC1|nr:probable serine/threonine-protein kinase DDB_G0282963 [Teleopsis dalmanni]
MSNARDLTLLEKWSDAATIPTILPPISPTSPKATKFCCCPNRRRYNLKQPKKSTLHARNIFIDNDFNYIDDVSHENYKSNNNQTPISSSAISNNKRPTVKYKRIGDTFATYNDSDLTATAAPTIQAPLTPTTTATTTNTTPTTIANYEESYSDYDDIIDIPSDTENYVVNVMNGIGIQPHQQTEQQLQLQHQQRQDSDASSQWRHDKNCHYLKQIDNCNSCSCFNDEHVNDDFVAATTDAATEARLTKSERLPQQDQQHYQQQHNQINGDKGNKNDNQSEYRNDHSNQQIQRLSNSEFRVNNKENNISNCNGNCSNCISSSTKTIATRAATTEHNNCFNKSCCNYCQIKTLKTYHKTNSNGIFENNCSSNCNCNSNSNSNSSSNSDSNKAKIDDTTQHKMTITTTNVAHRKRSECGLTTTATITATTPTTSTVSTSLPTTPTSPNFPHHLTPSRTTVIKTTMVKRSPLQETAIPATTTIATAVATNTERPSTMLQQTEIFDNMLHNNSNTNGINDNNNDVAYEPKRSVKERIAAIVAGNGKLLKHMFESIL